MSNPPPDSGALGLLDSILATEATPIPWQDSLGQTEMDTLAVLLEEPVPAPQSTTAEQPPADAVGGQPRADSSDGLLQEAPELVQTEWERTPQPGEPGEAENLAPDGMAAATPEPQTLPEGNQEGERPERVMSLLGESFGWSISIALQVPAPRAIPEIRLPKEVGTVTAAGNLINKLEQQAQKASGKLQEKLNEIEDQLSAELNESIRRITQKEEQTRANLSALKHSLFRGLAAKVESSAGDLVGQSHAGCQSIVRLLEDGKAGLEELSQPRSATAREMIDALVNKAGSLDETILAHLQKIGDSGAMTIASLSQASNQEMTVRQAELSDLLRKTLERATSSMRQASRESLAGLDKLQGTLSHELSAYRRLKILRQASLREALIDQLKQLQSEQNASVKAAADSLLSSSLRETAAAGRTDMLNLAAHLHAQLQDDLAQGAAFKLAELNPAFVRSKTELAILLQEVEELKVQVVKQRKKDLDWIVDALEHFITDKLQESKAASERTIDELSAIERTTQELCDASAIEGDPNLKDTKVLITQRLKKIGGALHDNVNESLRAQIANMEDNARSLQEELISSMEGYAFSVRKASETSLARVKEALKKAHSVIQSSQDNYLS